MHKVISNVINLCFVQKAIFDTLKFPNYIESKVTCSYLEIYNEELSDLLVDDEKLEERRTAQKLEIMETKSGGPVCR